MSNTDKTYSLLKANLFLTVLFLSLDKNEEDDLLYIKILLGAGAFLGVYDYLFTGSGSGSGGGGGGSGGGGGGSGGGGGGGGPTIPIPPVAPNTTWKPNTQYNVGDKITYNSIEWECITSHRSSTVFVFDTRYWRKPGPTIPIPPVAPNTTWKPNTQYNVGDRITYNNIGWECVISHRSSTVFVFDTRYWRKPSGSGPIVPIPPPPPINTNWKPNTRYNLGAEVSLNGKFFLCILPHTSGTNFDMSKWTPSGSPGVPGNPPVAGDLYWQRYTDYNRGHVIKYNDVSYTAIRDHNSGARFNENNWIPPTGNPPISPPTDRPPPPPRPPTGNPPFSPPTDRPPPPPRPPTGNPPISPPTDRPPPPKPISGSGGWLQFTRYAANEIVSWGGKRRYAKVAFTSGLTFNENNWIDVPGAGGATEWQRNKQYSTGDTVSYRGATLNCTKTHNSNNFLEIIFWEQPGQPVPAFELSEIHLRDKVRYSIDTSTSSNNEDVRRIVKHFGSNNFANFKKMAVQISSIMYPGGAQSNDVFRFGTETLSIKVGPINARVPNVIGRVLHGPMAVQKDFTIEVIDSTGGANDKDIIWPGNLGVFAHEMAHTFQFFWPYGPNYNAMPSRERHSRNFSEHYIGSVEGFADVVSNRWAIDTGLSVKGNADHKKKFVKWSAGYQDSALFFQYIMGSGHPYLVNDIQNSIGTRGYYKGDDPIKNATGRSVDDWWEMYKRKYA